MKLLVAKTKDQIEFCKEALFAFRPNLNEKTYIDLTMEMIRDQNFILAFIPDTDYTKAVSFIGYRVMHTLRTGWMIYIDDLYTNPEYRGKGYAGALLEYVDQIAVDLGIRSVHLDSGYMLHDAHRLYLNKGYVLGCNHFVKVMNK